MNWFCITAQAANRAVANRTSKYGTDFPDAFFAKEQADFRRQHPIVSHKKAAAPWGKYLELKQV
jgi:hypothetical protein